jgi:superoxide dismutase, Fe-Mn family
MYKLPELPYAFDALEPYIDTKTMEVHYTKHHQGYIDNLNKALEKYPNLACKSVDDLLRDLQTVPEEVRVAVRNQGGGHSNHTQFWTLMKKGGSVARGSVKEQIIKQFAHVESFQEQFNTAAKSVFGSGWAWLVVMPDDSLKIVTTANQDTPLSQGLTPIVGLDVWEHAYYLKYQNKRVDYIAAWWNVLNWDMIQEYYAQALQR